jgi:hypothetical protein
MSRCSRAWPPSRTAPASRRGFRTWPTCSSPSTRPSNPQQGLHRRSYQLVFRSLAHNSLDGPIPESPHQAASPRPCREQQPQRHRHALRPLIPATGAGIAGIWGPNSPPRWGIRGSNPIPRERESNRGGADACSRKTHLLDRR